MKGHSCETVLHELLSDLNIARDKRKIVMLLFIDFRKAFDTVDSNLLHYGFDNDSLRLISNYFKNREQIIKQSVSSHQIDQKSMSIKLGVLRAAALGHYVS